MKYTSYLFDFDGTLVDSMPYYVAAMLRVLDEGSIPHGEDIVSISAKTKEGLDDLLAMIGKRLDTGFYRVTLALPYDKGGILEMLYRDAKVESVEYDATIQVVAVCSEKTVGQVKDYIVDGWTQPKEFWED